MAFSGIAFDSCGVQCVCIFFLKHTMAFLGIAFGNGGVQSFCIFHSVARRVFLFLLIVNVDGETMLHFVTRLDVNILKKTPPCIFKCGIKRHTF